MKLMIDEGKEFSLRDSLSKTEQWFVGKTLNMREGCQVKAAQSLGMSDRQIRLLMKKVSY